MKRRLQQGFTLSVPWLDHQNWCLFSTSQHLKLNFASTSRNCQSQGLIHTNQTPKRVLCYYECQLPNFQWEVELPSWPEDSRPSQGTRALFAFDTVETDLALHLLPFSRECVQHFFQETPSGWYLRQGHTFYLKTTSVTPLYGYSLITWLNLGHL